MTFRVELSSNAMVQATLYVDANTRLEAEQLARKQAESGDVVWKYNGADNSQIEATSVSAQEF